MTRRLLFLVFLISQGISLYAQGQSRTWYYDGDGDGWGTADSLQVSETQPAGFVLNRQDCHDDIYNQLAWRPTGSLDFSGGIVNYTDIAVDSNGVVYVIFTDSTAQNRATVMKFEGGSWQVVGQRGFSNDRTLDNHIVIDSKGKLYVAYSEGINSKASVLSFNGTSWEDVGYSLFSIGPAYGVSLALDKDDVPYVVYADAILGVGAVVMKFDGLDWVPVGNDPFSTGMIQYPDIAFDKNNVPYVAFQDMSQANKTTVMKYDGSAWQQVGIAGFSAARADYISLAIDQNNIPYVSYTDRGNDYKATVMAFNGIEWDTVGVAGFSSGATGYTNIAFDVFNTPYIAFQDADSGSRATIMAFHDTAWEVAGSTGAGLTIQETRYMALAFDKENVAYMVGRENARATVMRMAPWGIQPDAPTGMGDVVSCYGTSMTLNVSPASHKYDADVWVWYADSNATVQLALGDTMTLNPDNDTTYYLRGEGTCLLTPGPVGSVKTHRKPMSLWYEDKDGDGWGAEDKPGFAACGQPVGYSAKLGDCNDNRASNTLIQSLNYVSPAVKPKIRFDKNDTPYVVSFNVTATSTKGPRGNIRVEKYNGTGWDTLGLLDDYFMKYWDMAIDHNGVIYVAYCANEGDRSQGINGLRDKLEVYVMKYEGGTWDSVGSAFHDIRWEKSQPTNDDLNLGIKIGADNLPFVYYYGDAPYMHSSILPKGLMVKKYNGTDWDTLHSDGMEPEAQIAYCINSQTGMPSYCATSADSTVQVNKYENGAWKTFGLPLNVPGINFIDPDLGDTVIFPYVDIMEVEQEVYIAYIDNWTPKVRKWNGAEWQLLGDLSGETITGQLFNSMLYTDNNQNIYLKTPRNSSTKLLQYNARNNQWDSVHGALQWSVLGNAVFNHKNVPYFNYGSTLFKQSLEKLPMYKPLIQGDTVICLGNAADLEIKTPLNDAGGWKWYTDTTGSSTSTGAFISPAPTVTTTYYARGEGGCLSQPTSFDHIRVRVKTLPAISLQSTQTVFCTNKDTIATLTGLPEGGVYSGPGVIGDNFNASKLAPGTYTLYYTYSENGAGCSGKDSISVTVNNCLGISPNNANLVKLYPNPASLQIIIENTYTQVDMVLYNTIGQPVMSKHFSGNLQLDISGLPAGIYLCKITYQDQVQTIRVVKE